MPRSSSVPHPVQCFAPAHWLMPRRTSQHLKPCSLSQIPQTQAYLEPTATFAITQQAVAYGKHMCFTLLVTGCRVCSLALTLIKSLLRLHYTAAVLGGDLYVERRSKLPPSFLFALAGIAGTAAVSNAVRACIVVGCHTIGTAEVLIRRMKSFKGH